jgi:hypothetical protein
MTVCGALINIAEVMLTKFATRSSRFLAEFFSGARPSTQSESNATAQSRKAQRFRELSTADGHG